MSIYLLLLALLGSLFLCAFALLNALLYRRPRWLHLMTMSWRRRELSERWARLLLVRRESATFMERQAWLIGIGYGGDAAVYVAVRQLLLVLLPLMAGYFYSQQMQFLLYAGLGIVALLLFGDRFWLEALRSMRSQRMTREIYVISNQLLYLQGSSLNIHAKLTRCLPYARTMRGDLQRLLGEWYHDAESALQRFKEKIGTEEGLSFVETISALRLHESEEYYQLLQERIEDYKEKLDLAKDSRKESASYLLFMLAGVPILYLFQIFIYPWVQEGQKLFQSLNP